VALQSGLFLHFQANTTQLDSIDITSLCLCAFEAKSILREVEFQTKDRTMENAQKCDSYMNVPLGHSYKY
jgi:hypothetical protein